MDPKHLLGESVACLQPNKARGLTQKEDQAVSHQDPDTFSVVPIQTVPKSSSPLCSSLPLLQSSLWSFFVLFCGSSPLDRRGYYLPAWMPLAVGSHFSSYKNAPSQTLFSACSVSSIIGRKHKAAELDPRGPGSNPSTASYPDFTWMVVFLSSEDLLWKLIYSWVCVS